MEEIRPGRYRHYKGKEYEVLYVTKHSETLEDIVNRCKRNDKIVF